MKIRVKIREFTYRDDKGYHTVVSEGDVPSTNPDVLDGLKRGVIEKLESTPSYYRTDEKPETKKEKKKSD